MPPAAIMGRVMFFFLLIAGVLTILYYIVIYLLKPKASVVAAKIDANHIVEEFKSEMTQQDVYSNATDKIKELKKNHNKKN